MHACSLKNEHTIYYCAQLNTKALLSSNKLILQLNYKLKFWNNLIRSILN